MKVVGISGSARLNGNTAILIRTVFAELEQEGIKTELIQLAEKHIQGCTACYACMKLKNQRCIREDDYLNECLERMIKADGIVLGSPVYAAGISSQLKALIDRASMVLAANRGLFRHKAGAVVVAARRGGALGAFDDLNHFLHSKEMFLVGSTYWNMVYGRDIGDVEKDAEGMENMRNLGKNMAWLLRRISNSEH